MKTSGYTQIGSMKKKVLLIKFGGSLITDKSVEQSCDRAALQHLAESVRSIREADPERAIVIGHGQGSFAHFPAKKYRLNEGLVLDDAAYGLAVTLDVVSQLNRIVVGALITEKLPAVSLSPSSILMSDDNKITTAFTATFFELLERGMIPVTTGDVLLDQSKGCSIWSADAALPYFARLLVEQGWSVEKIVHVTKTPGVYKDINHPERGTFRVITPRSFAESSAGIEGAGGTDVTGGMLEKVKQSLSLAQDGIESVILNNDDNALVRLMLAGEEIGTRVTKDS